MSRHLGVGRQHKPALRFHGAQRYPTSPFPHCAPDGIQHDPLQTAYGPDGRFAEEERSRVSASHWSARATGIRRRLALVIIARARSSSPNSFPSFSTFTSAKQVTELPLHARLRRPDNGSSVSFPSAYPRRETNYRNLLDPMRETCCAALSAVGCAVGCPVVCGPGSVYLATYP
ncbi:hypothetical protein VTG60DRAFT_1158 [Thermothelomyces hinnuleus]